MLETIREFALEALAGSGGLAEARRRHAAYFLSLAERVDLESRIGDQANLFAQLELENANLRSAVEWTRDTERADLLLRLATALWSFWAVRGHVAEGKSALEDAVAISESPPARALLGLCTLRMLGGETKGLLAAAQEALSACEDTDDDFSLAQAWNLIGRIEGSVLADLTRGEQAWRRGLSYAERGNYTAERAESISWLMVSAVFGALPAPKGIELCKEFFETAGEDEVIRAFCRVERAALEAMTGQFDVARELLAEGTRVITELGLNVYAAVIGQEAFYVEMLAGNPEAAVSTLRASYTALEQMGERRELATIAGFLAHALYEQGDFAEAERFSRASENAAAPDDVHAQVLWRSARAKTLGRQGEHESAEAIARGAVHLVEPTDLLNARGYALLDLAEVLALGSRPEEAIAVAREAARRFEQKGNLPSLQRALKVANAPAPTASP
jgi:tetratricopeptide (TPR) repeat protein